MKINSLEEKKFEASIQSIHTFNLTWVNVDEEPDLTPIPIEIMQQYELENELDRLISDQCEENVEIGSDISVIRRTFRVSPESAEFSKHRSFQENLKNRLWITFNMDDLDAIDGTIRTAKLRVHKVRTKEDQQFPVSLFQVSSKIKSPNADQFQWQFHKYYLWNCH